MLFGNQTYDPLMYVMNHTKCIVSFQMEEPTRIQKGKNDILERFRLKGTKSEAFATVAEIQNVSGKSCVSV